MVKITRGMARVLRHFVREYTIGAPVTSTSAHRAGISAGTFLTCVAELVGNGWVESKGDQPDPFDGSTRYYYQLTRPGYTKALQALQEWDRRFDLLGWIKRKVT